jgi:hypothetical protein
VVVPERSLHQMPTLVQGHLEEGGHLEEDGHQRDEEHHRVRPMGSAPGGEDGEESISERVRGMERERESHQARMCSG